eukprot:2332379-Amphidinium_carterae.1
MGRFLVFDHHTFRGARFADPLCKCSYATARHAGSRKHSTSAAHFPAVRLPKHTQLVIQA